MHLGNDRFVTVQSFKGRSRVDIRQYNRYGEKIYPTKLGIYLTGKQFAQLLHIFKGINNSVMAFHDKFLESFKFNIGDGMFVTASSGFPFIHIRLYYQNEDMPIAAPTKMGIALRFEEWETLISLVENVQKRIELLETI